MHDFIKEWGRFIRALFSPSPIIGLVATVGLLYMADQAPAAWMEGHARVALNVLATLAAGFFMEQLLQRAWDTPKPLFVKKEVCRDIIHMTRHRIAKAQAVSVDVEQAMDLVEKTLEGSEEKYGSVLIKDAVAVEDRKPFYNRDIFGWLKSRSKAKNEAAADKQKAPAEQEKLHQQ